MKDFAYHRPPSVAAASALLRDDPNAKLLAGGQSLIPVLKLDLAQPSSLVSLAALAPPAPGDPLAPLAPEAELRQIRSQGDSLVIGALATHDQVATSAEVQRRIPALAALAAGIGDAQVRNRGTLGGSLAHADPSADYPAAVIALGATIETDRRRIAADDFFTGLFATALAPDEIITAVQFPVPDRAAYVKFAHRASKYAVVGVMVAQAAGKAGVRVAVTGAGSKVFRLPALEAALAERFSPDAVNAAAGAAHGAGAPGAVSGNVAALGGFAVDELRSDGEASAEYRAHLISVMAGRAIQACL